MLINVSTINFIHAYFFSSFLLGKDYKSSLESDFKKWYKNANPRVAFVYEDDP